MGICRACGEIRHRRALAPGSEFSGSTCSAASALVALMNGRVDLKWVFVALVARFAIGVLWHRAASSAARLARPRPLWNPWRMSKRILPPKRPPGPSGTHAPVRAASPRETGRSDYHAREGVDAPVAAIAIAREK